MAAEDVSKILQILDIKPTGGQCPIKDDDNMTNVLKRLLMYLKDEKECSLILSIPESSGSEMEYYYLLPEGETLMDFENGVIQLPGGTTDQMRTSLLVQKKDVLRSMRMFSDNDVALTIEGMGTLTVIGGETVSLCKLCFKNLYIKTTQATNLRLLVSTSEHVLDSDVIAPQMVYEELYDAPESDENIVSLDTGVFSRIIVELVASATLATPFVLECSMDNIHWFTAMTWGATTSIHQSFNNAFRYMRMKNTPLAGVGKISIVITATR